MRRSWRCAESWLVVLLTFAAGCDDEEDADGAPDVAADAMPDSGADGGVEEDADAGGDSEDDAANGTDADVADETADEPAPETGFDADSGVAEEADADAPEPNFAPTGFASTRTQWWVPDSDTTGGFFAVEWAELPNHIWYFADMDGDGLADLVQTADAGNTAFGSQAVWGVTDSPYWRVFLNEGGGFADSAEQWPVPPSGTAEGFFAFVVTGLGSYWSVVDMNGDRRPDLVQTADAAQNAAVWGESTEAPYWKVFLNTGDGFAGEVLSWPVPIVETAGGVYTTGFDQATAWSLVDLDGDDLPDLVHTADAGGDVWGLTDDPYWRVFFNTGEGFETEPTTWSVPVSGTFDGFSASQAGRFGDSAFWALRDLNGDGRLDLVQTADPSSVDATVWGVSDEPYWRVFWNTGTGFEGVASEWAVPPSGLADGFYAMAANQLVRHWDLLDVTADGLPDLVQTGDPERGGVVWGQSDEPYWKVFENTGAAFETSARSWPVPDSGTSPGFNDTAAGAANEYWQTVDIDGDGGLDLVQAGDWAEGERVWGLSDRPYWRVFLASE